MRVKQANFSLTRTNIIVEVICSLFIILFVYAALSKVLDFQKFRVELGKSPVLNSLSSFVAYSIPIIEILISIALSIKKMQYVTLYAAFSLMVMFSTYIVIILNFSSYIPCSCGGVLQNMTWLQHLIFNLFFILFATIAILINPGTKILSAQ